MTSSEIEEYCIKQGNVAYIADSQCQCVRTVVVFYYDDEMEDYYCRSIKDGNVSYEGDFTRMQHQIFKYKLEAQKHLVEQISCNIYYLKNVVKKIKKEIKKGLER